MSDESDTSSDWESWIQDIVRLNDHHFLSEVDESYIEDSFNLYGLKEISPLYEKAIDMMLGPSNRDDMDCSSDDHQRVFQVATELYILIHARFIVYKQGMEHMKERYLLNDFGKWPRIKCQNQRVLPYGTSYKIGKSTVKIYCPLWQEVYKPNGGKLRLDGASFGPGFPATFLQAFPELRVDNQYSQHIPKLFGFRIFGMRGSKYEYKYDEEGNCSNITEINEVLDNKRTDAYDGTIGIRSKRHN